MENERLILGRTKSVFVEKLKKRAKLVVNERLTNEMGCSRMMNERNGLFTNDERMK